MAFIDFAELKSRVSIEAVAAMLDLNLKEAGPALRGPCPVCGGERSLVITPAKSAYYCFADSKGGDQIALAAHVLGLTVKEAAQELLRRNGTSTRTGTQSTVPREHVGSETQKLAPLAYLQADHPAVDAIGFDPEFCKTHGIGYAGKGTARGYVLIPFRDEHGNLLGYVGVTEAWLPKDFQPTNVIQLKRA